MKTKISFLVKAIVVTTIALAVYPIVFVDNISAQILAPRSAEADAIKSIFSNIKSPDSLNKDSIVGPFSDATLKAQQVIRNVMSPYCPGLSLESCPSPEANVLRNEIRRVVAAGESEENIRKTLVENYGGAVLGIPPDDGFGKLSWAMPFVVLIAAGAVITVWLRRKVKKEGKKEVVIEPSSSSSEVHDAELLKRLNEEMKKG